MSQDTPVPPIGDPAPRQVFPFSYKGLAIALVKAQGLHRGIWRGLLREILPRVLEVFTFGLAFHLSHKGAWLGAAYVMLLALWMRDIRNLPNKS